MVALSYSESNLRPGDVFFFMVSDKAKEDGVPDRVGIFSSQREMTIMTSQGPVPKEQMTDVPYFIEETFIIAKRYTEGKQ